MEETKAKRLVPGLPRGIYLGAYRAFHPEHDLIYQDINGLRDLGGDMMDVDLSPFDYVIATPPCNWWSKARGSRKASDYAENTKHLLIDILGKLLELQKPFLVENVRNFPKFKAHGLIDLPCFVYFIGRHTYWTNVMLSADVLQTKDHIKFISSNVRQGGSNVHDVVERFLYTIGA